LIISAFTFLAFARQLTTLKELKNAKRVTVHFISIKRVASHLIVCQYAQPPLQIRRLKEER